MRDYGKAFFEEVEKTGELTNFTVYKKEYPPDRSEVTLQALPKTKRKIYFSEHKQKLYV